ncbi:uncharacterized protein EI90DRAFT_2423716 [Cantharellus anzutake]|uniref:uncharacterized protein n=1 Tax=Cantharellus anzutake TaxID=1750568 RepID=UPI00190549B2|nr:uncharacterized protein EI90DRAFT_2423716 [Cantharellus anzutake]KAF8338864.1 hypothetical protein EI90DRAFT_2423716 [Cantharellus anzutake]
MGIRRTAKADLERYYASKGTYNMWFLTALALTMVVLSSPGISKDGATNMPPSLGLTIPLLRTEYAPTHVGDTRLGLKVAMLQGNIYTQQSLPLMLRRPQLVKGFAEKCSFKDTSSTFTFETSHGLGYLILGCRVVCVAANSVSIYVVLSHGTEIDYKRLFLSVPLLHAGPKHQVLAAAWAFIGGTSFEVGAFLMFVESLNSGHEVLYKKALGDFQAKTRTRENRRGRNLVYHTHSR